MKKRIQRLVTDLRQQFQRHERRPAVGGHGRVPGPVGAGPLMPTQRRGHLRRHPPLHPAGQYLFFSFRFLWKRRRRNNPL